jgi:phage/plasmid-associated DNA primase
MACSRKLCVSRTIRSNRNEMMLPISRTFLLTHDDHLPHNNFTSVARRCSDRLQLGMSDFLRRNPHTGCDRITAEIKYRDSFEFTPFARLLFSANRLPASSDASQAFFDRWLIIPFKNPFRHTRLEIPRRILEARLCAPNELSGALNKALDGLDSVRRYFRFTEPKESRVAVRRYQSENDALAAWLDEHTVVSPDASVTQAELHAAYESHCWKSCRRPASKQMLGRRLRELRPHIESAQRSAARERWWVYTGIGLRGNADDGRKA